jgi:pSer/pThr/pTyr-binding forkhead associated (FHA) protein
MASLVVLKGPGQGSHFPLTEPLVSVGREDDCTFQVLDPMVSRRHLQVRRDEANGAHLAADYRSAHGVFVNGKRILLPTPLSDGDKIKIGETTLVYLASDHPDAPTAMAAAKKKDEWKHTTLMGRE